MANVRYIKVSNVTPISLIFLKNPMRKQFFKKIKGERSERTKREEIKER